MASKVYKLKAGECENCTLYSNCTNNKKAIKHFLLMLGILCETGKCLDVVEDLK